MQVIVVPHHPIGSMMAGKEKLDILTKIGLAHCAQTMKVRVAPTTTTGAHLSGQRKVRKLLASGDITWYSNSKDPFIPPIPTEDHIGG